MDMISYALVNCQFVTPMGISATSRKCRKGSNVLLTTTVTNIVDDKKGKTGGRGTDELMGEARSRVAQRYS